MVDTCLQDTPSSSKSSRSSAKTPNSTAKVTGPLVKLDTFATTAVLRKLSSIVTAEVIARIGDRWHNAHNKGMVASIIRNHIINTDMEGIGDSYDSMRKLYPAGEVVMVVRFLRSGQHAARKHRENVAKIVASLFRDTPADAALVHVKKEVFGVEGGKAIMNDDHPAIKEMLGLPKGDHCFNSPVQYNHLLTHSCSGEATKLVLFETAESAAAGEVAASGDQSKDIQINFTDFIANLFHFKAGAKGYSIDPDRFGQVPLFLKNKDENTVLNDFFFYIFSRALTWQSLTRYNPRKPNHDWPGGYVAIEASASGPELPAVPWLSKNFVAYLESFLGAAPYYKTTDTRNKLERRFAKALKGLNSLDNAKFDQYVMRKLRAWYTKFPPKPRGEGGAADSDEDVAEAGDGAETPAAGDSGPELSGDEK